jgi:hypothetical protein
MSAEAQGCAHVKLRLVLPDCGPGGAAAGIAGSSCKARQATNPVLFHLAAPRVPTSAPTSHAFMLDDRRRARACVSLFLSVRGFMFVGPRPSPLIGFRDWRAVSSTGSVRALPTTGIRQLVAAYNQPEHARSAMARLCGIGLLLRDSDDHLEVLFLSLPAFAPFPPTAPVRSGLQ